MKVLIVGRGGREHALCWKVKQSPLVSKVFAATGNTGMEDCATLVPIRECDHKARFQFAQRKGVDLTIVWPEAPLHDGLADRFQEEGLKVFGPSQAISSAIRTPLKKLISTVYPWSLRLSGTSNIKGEVEP